MVWYSQTYMSCTKLLGTRSNSRHTSGSMLNGSKHLDAERSKKQSEDYWRNDMCVSVGSCLSRMYCLSQRLLASEFSPFLSSCYYMLVKNLWMYTHFTHTSCGSPTQSTYDWRGRKSQGILWRDERYTPALLSLWVDRTISETRRRLYSGATLRGRRSNGWINHRWGRHSPSWTATLSSRCRSGRGTSSAARLCCYLCQIWQSNCMGRTRVCFDSLFFISHLTSAQS